MIFLHPVFTVLLIFLILYSYIEVYGDDKRKISFALWVLGIYMVVIIGFRKYVGADYSIYYGMYNLYFPTVESSDIFNKALFRDSTIEIEWLYILLNKIIFLTGSPFFVFTFISACITVGVKLVVYYKNSAYPFFSMLLFIIPGYFIGDSGHMRQALGMTICLLSFKFIKDRNVWMYLLCMYIAIGFHKSTIAFFPMYWVALIPMNSKRIFIAIAISIVLSPFQVYNLFSGFLNSLDIQDLSNGINGYIMYEAKSSLFMDALMVVYAILLVAFDKPASKKIYYYEYMRNIVITGVCMYFIMRDNPVFSTRLVGSFQGFIPLVIPNIIAAIDNVNVKKGLHLYFVSFVIFYYFVFASFQGEKGSFTPDKYQNYIWNQ